MYRRCSCQAKGCRCGQGREDINSLSRDLTILAVKSRLEILLHLNDERHCVCDLMEHTDMSQSLISHHLADLAKAGMIAGKKEGKFKDYWLTEKGKRYVEGLLKIAVHI